MTVLAIVVWACVMWVSEALPVGITGIGIPTLLIVTQALPWKNGKPPLVQVFGGFTTEVLWLCLFAFFVGAIMQLLKLDRRIALGLLDRLKASDCGARNLGDVSRERGACVSSSRQPMRGPRRFCR